MKGANKSKSYTFHELFVGLEPKGVGGLGRWADTGGHAEKSLEPRGVEVPLRLGDRPCFVIIPSSAARRMVGRERETER